MSADPTAGRLLVASLRYPPYVSGGYELSCAESVTELRDRGWRVDVLCGKGTQFESDAGCLPWLEPGLDGVDPWESVHQSGFAEHWRRFMHHPGNVATTRRALQETKADLLLYFNLGLVTPAPLVAARELGVPTFGQIYDRWPTNLWLEGWRERGNKRGRRWLLETAWSRLRDRAEWGTWWVPSSSMERELSSSGFASQAMERVPLPLPRDARAGALERGAPSAGGAALTRREAGEPLRVLCTSSHWHGKGIHVAIEALELAISSGADLHLELLGDGGGDYPARIREQARALGDRVSFAGRVSRSEVLAALGRAHALVFPSLWSEPFGLATLEGLAYGLPVLASDAGASGELVSDGVDGRVLPAGNAQELARALAVLERDEELRCAWGASGRERILSDYGHAAFYDRMHRTCLELAGAGARR